MTSIVNGWVEGADLVIRCREDDGTTRERRTRAEYSLFVKDAEVPPDVRRQIVQSRYVAGTALEGEYVRVRWTDGEARRQAKQRFKDLGIQTYEADVSPVRRFLADRSLATARPRRCFIDIETDSRVKIVNKKRARILSWAIVGEDDFEKTGVLARFTADDERTLLEEFWNTLIERGYELLIAWNGDRFDFPMIKDRTDEAGVSRSIVRSFHQFLYLDQMELFKRMTMNTGDGDEKASLKLEEIGRVVVGEGKHTEGGIVEGQPLGAQTYEMWAAGGEYRDRMVAYMLQDARLLKKIEAKKGHVDLLCSICEACSAFPDSRGTHPTEHAEGFLLPISARRGIRWKTREYVEDRGDKFRGAFVLESEGKGIEKNVHVADFSSMYPSIMLAWNISPDTKAADVPVNGPLPPDRSRAPKTGVGFRTDVEGLVIAAIREMLRLRKYWSDLQATLPPGSPEWKAAGLRSMAYKVAANSFYGVLGAMESLFFDRDCAEAVAQNGAYLIGKVLDAAMERGWDPRAADTDSCFIAGVSSEEFAEFVKWCNQVLIPGLLEECGCVERGMVKIAYEKEFERIVLVGKKRYCAKWAHLKGTKAKEDAEPEIKGLEFKRGDANRNTRKMMKETIDLLMKARSEDPADFEPVIEKWKHHVLEESLDAEEVRISQSLSKPLREYEPKKKKNGEDAVQERHVRVAKILRERGEDVSKGTRIEFYVRDDTKDPMEVAPISDFAGDADRHYLWETLVWPPTMRLLKAAFPTHDWSKWDRTRPSKRARGLPGQGSLFS